jgi:acyl carrier protein
MEGSLSPFELEVARLIVDTLNLEDVSAEEIEPEAPLFGEGLGLDSIDALELSLAVSKTYGVQMRSDDPDNVNTFASLRALAGHIEERHRAQ